MLYAHQQLTLEHLPRSAEAVAAGMTGSWRLRSIVGLPEEHFNSDSSGRCIVTGEGFVSVLIGASNRLGVNFVDPRLATENELQLALQTVFSWLGRLEAAEAGAVLRTLAWQASGALDSEQVLIECAENRLKISWRYAHTPDDWCIVHSEWSRLT